MNTLNCHYIYVFAADTGQGDLLKTQIYLCHTVLCSELVDSRCSEDEIGKPSKDQQSPPGSSL